MHDFDQLIIKNPGLIASFGGSRLSGLEVKLEDFIKTLETS